MKREYSMMCRKYDLVLHPMGEYGFNLSFSTNSSRWKLFECSNTSLLDYKNANNALRFCYRVSGRSINLPAFVKNPCLFSNRNYKKDSVVFGGNFRCVFYPISFRFVLFLLFILAWMFGKPSWYLTMTFRNEKSSSRQSP